MKKVLYLMRHGQTMFNVRRKIQGWCDAPLTEEGKKQAMVAGEYFQKEKIVFDHAYASTSERACDTLEFITSMPYTRLKGLKEWNFGIFEGESEDLNPPLPYGDFFKTYDGEGEKEVRDRIVQTLQEVINKENHKIVLAVSHGATCAQFYRAWESYAKVKKEGKFHNCCILKFVYENGIFTLTQIIEHNFS